MVMARTGDASRHIREYDVRDEHPVLIDEPADDGFVALGGGQGCRS